MGTRSLTHIYEMDSLGGDLICTFYRHFDGYPDGHGLDLAQWLNGKNLVNGIRSDFVVGRDYNRAGSLAIDLMYHIRKESGAEAVPTGSEDMWEDYTYHVKFGSEGFTISYDGYDDDDEPKTFVFTPQEFIDEYG